MEKVISNLEYLMKYSPRTAEEIINSINQEVIRSKNEEILERNISIFHKFFFLRTLMGYKSSFAIRQRNFERKPTLSKNPIDCQIPDNLSKYFLDKLDYLNDFKEEEAEEKRKKKFPFGISELEAERLSSIKIVLASRNDKVTKASDFMSLFAKGSKFIDSSKSLHGQKLINQAKNPSVDFVIFDLRRVKHAEYWSQKKSLKKDFSDKMIVVEPNQSFRDVLEKILERSDL